MQSKKNSRLNKNLKIFLYFLLVTGVMYTLILCGILPKVGGYLWRSLHIFSGFIFLILVGAHMSKYWKWYKAWITGKLKSEKSKQTKSISIYFFLMIFSISSDGFLPRGLYLFTHVLIGTVWIIGIIRHFRSKKHVARNENSKKQLNSSVQIYQDNKTSSVR